MGRRSSNVIRVGLILCLLAVAPAMGAPEQQEKGAPTPEEATKRLYANLQEGKVTDALSYIGSLNAVSGRSTCKLPRPRRTTPSRWRTSSGKDPEFRQKLVLRGYEKPDFAIEIREVKEAGKDTVQLIIWERRSSPGILERKLNAVKTQTGWKLRYPGSPKLAKAEDRKGSDGKKFVVWVESETENSHKNKKAEIDFILVEAPKQAQAVRDGKYKTRQEAFEELKKRASESTTVERCLIDVVPGTSPLDDVELK